LPHASSAPGIERGQAPQNQANGTGLIHRQEQVTAPYWQLSDMRDPLERLVLLSGRSAGQVAHAHPAAP
jgi:hypothetical protein